MKTKFKIKLQIMLLSLLVAQVPFVSAAVTETELAGGALSQYPFFEYVKAINEDNIVEVAIDPTRFPTIVGQTCDIYVVDAKGTSDWTSNNTLIDITSGGTQTETFAGATIQANTFQVTIPFELNATVGVDLGVGYDVIFDCNQDGLLNGDDFIDGRRNESGFYAIHDTTASGPLAVTILTYNLSPAVGTTFGIPLSHLSERTYFPTNVGSMSGTLPLVVISHGNGHNYAWYDHIGSHLASYGYVVMSHANNTGGIGSIGVMNASTTTLGHTDAFIDQVAAGAIDPNLVGKLNNHRIVWVGHSRGAEGVSIAYDRIFDGTYTPVNYTNNHLTPDDIGINPHNDIRLISSMLPTDFLGTAQSNPHDANYHLWTASGDSDVSGSASQALIQTFHLHDRAVGQRQSTVVQGTGHTWFHDNGGFAWFSGPCSIGEANTHLIQRGHFLPLVKRYVEDNIPSLDFLTRQYESFRPMGVPTGNPCIVVTHEYVDASINTVTNNQKTITIDNYQAGFANGTSSSGANVTFNVNNLTEGIMDDNNFTFTWSAADPFNGATQAEVALPTYNDTSRGVVFDWTGSNRFYEWEVPVGERDFTDNLFLAFRGAQGTQHPNTLAVLGDLTFSVTLQDSSAVSSSINIGAFGGGLEQPYQRSGGWHNEMETIRIRLTDFLNNGSSLDLTDIETITLDVGPTWGSNEGRIVIDELMLTNDRYVYDARDNGDPHLTTVNGFHYDFHSMGEFTALRVDGDMQIQTRQSPITTANPIYNNHTGLTSCVSANTAVAAQIGQHRVSYQPDLNGIANPNGMDLRIDGILQNLNPAGINVGPSGRVLPSPSGNGIEIEFPDGTSLIADSWWWSSQSKWMLQISVFSTPADEGLLGNINTGNWLPKLSDGSTLGAKPASSNQRYIDLNKTFADSWRVTHASSLFEYAPGQSTNTFTNKNWPPQSGPCVVPNSPPVQPLSEDRAIALCRTVKDRDDNKDCVVDVQLTGEPGFAKAYIRSQTIRDGATRTIISNDKNPLEPQESIIFVAVVTQLSAIGDRVPHGDVQFFIKGEKFNEPVKLDERGRVKLKIPYQFVKNNEIVAEFIPSQGSVFLPSRSFKHIDK